MNKCLIPYIRAEDDPNDLTTYKYVKKKYGINEKKGKYIKIEDNLRLQHPPMLRILHVLMHKN